MKVHATAFPCGDERDSAIRKEHTWHADLRSHHRSQRQAHRVSRRGPESLAGLRIGLVDNTKHNSDQLLLRIADILEEKHGAKTHIIRKKKSAGAAPHAEIVEEFKAHCDVIVAGVGD